MLFVKKFWYLVVLPLFLAIGSDYAKAAADGVLSNTELVSLSSVVVAFFIGLGSKWPSSWDGNDRRGGSSTEEPVKNEPQE